MPEVAINGVPVPLEIYNQPSGADAAEPTLSSAQVTLLERLDASIRSAGRTSGRYPDAALSLLRWFVGVPTNFSGNRFDERCPFELIYVDNGSQVPIRGYGAERAGAKALVDFEHAIAVADVQESEG